MDVLCDEYRKLMGGECFILFNAEKWNAFEGKWEIWENKNGDDIKAYDIDENFRLIPPSE